MNNEIIARARPSLAADFGVESKVSENAGLTGAANKPSSLNSAASATPPIP
jgi:hypothetical protein